MARQQRNSAQAKSEPFAEYSRELQQKLRTGKATEHTYRSGLQQFIESLRDGIVATNEPKRVRCGAPDYIVSKAVGRSFVPLGYIEAKDLTENLDAVVATEQIVRYLGSLSNLIVTNYLEFRWYVAGIHRMTISIGNKVGNRIVFKPDAGERLGQLLRSFFDAEVPTISSAEDLAMRLAGVSKSIQLLILNAFKHDTETATWLKRWLKAFRDVLIHDLTEEAFADMFAQTLTYGLFAARVHHKDKTDFSRFSAAKILPKTNPFLRQLFAQFAGLNMPETISWAVDETVEILKKADMAKVLSDFREDEGKSDPVVHFYETFLAAYNPELRDTRGVYYTPDPAVNFIVRGTDDLVKAKFGLPKGLADEAALILDPAVGTASFLNRVVDTIYSRFKRNVGLWDQYVAEKLLGRVFGFEILMAPYSVAHLKLGMKLRDTGYEFKANQRLGVFLTNTLEEAAKKSDELLFQWISDEANQASSIKRDKPIMIVVGNPPYSGHSSNKGEWIQSLIESYKEGCPELKKPGQAKWLSDDYVKFIRFAQWRVEKTGHGMIGFITNHGYLDNPTFRGMRRSLMQAFDTLYLINLHGSAKRPSGADEDENIFDIQQGVAIGFFVRTQDRSAAEKRVFYYDCIGTRKQKHDWLTNTSLKDIPWVELAPSQPGYLFVPEDKSNKEEYERGWRIPDIFSLSGDPAPGIVTTHDEFAISWTRDLAEEKVNQLLETESEAEARNLFKLCSQDQWSYQRAKSELADGKWREKLTTILYRPFDVRWTVYDRNVAVHRRERATGHLFNQPNIALITNRQVNGDFHHVFCASTLIGDCTLSTASKERSYLFPLYLYDANDAEEQKSFDLSEGKAHINLSSQFIASIQAHTGVPFSVLRENGTESFDETDVFSYVYAVLHSKSYRKRYADFLKRDFPRIPVPASKTIFFALAEVGHQLIRIHLGNGEISEDLESTFPKRGSGKVECHKFDATLSQVKINDEQFFDKVSEEVWSFVVGGYQICEKWLKDRKGRRLSSNEIEHYSWMVAAIRKTIELQKSIETAIKGNHGWPLDGDLADAAEIAGVLKDASLAEKELLLGVQAELSVKRKATKKN